LSANGIGEIDKAYAQRLPSFVAPGDATASPDVHSWPKGKSEIDFVLKGNWVCHLHGGAVFAEVEQKAAVTLTPDFDIFKGLKFPARRTAFKNHGGILQEESHYRRVGAGLTPLYRNR
jgi:hypothetical protein